MQLRIVLSMESLMPAAETSSSLPKRVAIGGGLGAAALSATALGQTIAPAAAPTPAAADAAMQLPTVEIGASNVQQGYQVNLPSLARFTQPLLDTPQSVSVVPRQLIDDQGIVQTRDALRNVPGISLGAGEAGAQGDNLTLRGFSARNDFYLDGMRDFGSYYRDPFDLEAIEVLKGPSSVAFGRGSTGGVINQVQQAARHHADHGGNGELRHGRDQADHRRHQPGDRRDPGGGGPAERDGGRERGGGPQPRHLSPVRHRALHRVRAGNADAAGDQLPAPAGLRHAGLRAAVACMASRRR